MDRIALYSHDAVGLGHLRRNLAIARALASDGRRSVLLVTGTREAAAFPLPHGVDVLTLPAFSKDGRSGYRPRTLRTSAPRLSAIRASAIQAALEAFDPSALIVDKHPLGLESELEVTLERLAGRGTRLVLGLRDVLDDPRTARREWERDGGAEAVRALYSDVWVYGDPRVYDVVREVGLGDDVAAKAQYTGYLGREHAGAEGPARRRRHAGVPRGRLAVCLVGGGEDGYDLASAFVDAPLPARVGGVVVTGPHMRPDDRERLRRRASDRMQVLDFLPEPAALVRRAERVIAMGGYNTVCELLAQDKSALIVPRVTPRREQLIRARSLSEHGVLDMLHPAEATPNALGRWLASEPRRRARPGDVVDLCGLFRIPELLRQGATNAA